jgi:sarcosine oxidase
MAIFDVAVVGLGAMGAAATYALASRGKRIVAFDRYEPGHDRGSSHGESRMIRTAYFEDPAYVPLVRKAYEAWRRLEARTGERVLTRTGIIEAGPPGSRTVAASLLSAREHDIPHEMLTAAEVSARFPAYALPAGWDGLFQADGGVLEPERAIRLQVASAADSGAVIRPNTPVMGVEPIGDRVRVTLESGETLEAGSAIVAAGPWMGEMVPALSPHLELTRQCVMWFEPAAPGDVTPARMPTFLIDTGDDLIYGLPNIAGSGVKAGSHLSSGRLESAGAERLQVTAEEIRAVGDALTRLIPGAAGPVLRTSTCIYTRTRDEHFVIGPHPAAPRIVLASPCSGHGFKFAALFGDVLADLALDGATTTPIGLFDPRRLLG